MSQYKYKVAPVPSHQPLDEFINAWGEKGWRLIQIITYEQGGRNAIFEATKDLHENTRTRP